MSESFNHESASSAQLVSELKDEVKKLEGKLKREEDRLSDGNIGYRYIKKLEGKLKVAVETLESIKHENLDDKTPTRYIKALQSWRDKVCKISWDTIKKIEE